MDQLLKNDGYVFNLQFPDHKWQFLAGGHLLKIVNCRSKAFKCKYIYVCRQMFPTGTLLILFFFLEPTEPSKFKKNVQAARPGASLFKLKLIDDANSDTSTEIFKETSSSEGSLLDLPSDSKEDKLELVPMVEISSDEELEKRMVEMEKMVSIELDSSD